MIDLTGSALAEALRDRDLLERELRVGDRAVVWLAWSGQRIAAAGVRGRPSCH